MLVDQIVFEIAGIVFLYKYNRFIDIKNNMTINQFFVNETDHYDIVNYINIDPNYEIDKYNMRQAEFSTPAWTKKGEYVVFHPNGEVIAISKQINGYKEVQTYMDKIDTTMHPLPICVTGFLLQRYLMEKQTGFVMHGASLRIGNHGIILTGNSGVGKSTLSSLFRKYAEVEQISDDRLILVKKGDKFYAYGNPFDTKIERNLNNGIEVTKILFIEHGVQNSISKLEKKETLIRLLKICMLPYDNCYALGWGMDYVNDLATKVPCYTLPFVPESSIISFIKDFMEIEDA